MLLVVKPNSIKAEGMLVRLVTYSGCWRTPRSLRPMTVRKSSCTVWANWILWA